jgi:hypothetical protein
MNILTESSPSSTSPSTSNSSPSPPSSKPKSSPSYVLSAPNAPRTQANPTPQLPFWALVSFGAYLLFKLGYGVFTFNDVPAAHAELMQEIDIARADLRTKGVDVD